MDCFVQITTSGSSNSGQTDAYSRISGIQALALCFIVAEQVRFPSESTRSFEARGAVMLGMQADYASTLQARIQGPAQHRVLWMPHGRLYVKVLALLQHSLRDMAMLWPDQQGGEKAFMHTNRENLKKWAAWSRCATADLHEADPACSDDEVTTATVPDTGAPCPL